jgi:hypothetical protein
MSSGAEKIEWMYRNVKPEMHKRHLERLIGNCERDLNRSIGSFRQEYIEESLYDLSLELLKHEGLDK